MLIRATKKPRRQTDLEHTQNLRSQVAFIKAVSKPLITSAQIAYFISTICAAFIFHMFHQFINVFPYGWPITVAVWGIGLCRVAPCLLTATVFPSVAALESRWHQSRSVIVVEFNQTYASCTPVPFHLGRLVIVRIPSPEARQHMCWMNIIVPSPGILARWHGGTRLFYFWSLYTWFVHPEHNWTPQDHNIGNLWRLIFRWSHFNHFHSPWNYITTHPHPATSYWFYC